jgi:RHS repeat-associated protein
MRPLLTAVALLALALAAAAGEVGSARLDIAGAALEIDPSVVTGADIPAQVQTKLGGKTGGDVPASSLTVAADLTGPGLDAPLTLFAKPGEKLSLPPLHEQGDYALLNVRLLDDKGRFLQPAVPASVSVKVVGVLSTSVSVRQLTPDELRARGITVDSRNYDVYDYSFTFAIGEQNIVVPYPVIIDKRTHEVVTAPGPSDYALPKPVIGATPPRFQPPAVYSLVMEFEDLNGPPVLPPPGGDLPDQQRRRPVIPAALVIPTGFGVLHQFGFGLGVYDFNAIESNHWTAPLPDPNPPNGYIPKLEQVLISDAKYQPQCEPPPPPPAPLVYSCNPTEAADAGQHCAIPDLAFSPESLVLSSTAPSFVVYGLHPALGLVDFPINPPQADQVDPTCARKLGLTLAARVQWPSSGAARPFDHPRLNTLRKEYVKYSKLWTSVERQPFARFNSLALYSRNNASGDTTEYALIAARDYGLLVVALDPTRKLERDALVDVVWTPAGAYSVRIVPGASVATLVDGAGRVLLVDLTHIDESKSVSSDLSCGNPDSCDAELFPTAAKAIRLAPAPPLKDQSWYEVGADDPRILWKSKPGDANHTTLAPVIDPDTGMLYQGDYDESLTRIQSASDPRVRITADLGAPSGPQEISGVTPLGIAPKDPPTCTPPACNASPAAFRVEVALPGAMTESLPASGGMLRVALESELVPNGVAAQTPEPLPRAHLRNANSSGTLDVRRIDFGLRRLLPDTLPPEFANLRYQRGFNRYISPWIVALADPRAAKQWSWGGASAAEKAKKGCYSCDRPPSLAALNEPDVYEIFTTGRFISVRPEVNAFTGTYQHLQKSQRFGARIATVMADTVRDPEVTVAALYPPVARGLLQETTYLHSGEVEVGAIDLDAGGRTGWNVILDRTYRSRTLGATVLGFGWESSMLKRLRPLPNGDVEFRDGAGEMYLFKKNGRTIQTPYDSPHGVFLALRSSNGGWTLIDQRRRITSFDTFGRVVLEGDEFYQLDGSGNAVAYRYDAGGRLKSIADPVGRVTTIDYFDDDQPAAGMIKEITDWRDRKIAYVYDAGLLKEAKLPQVTHEDGGGRPTIKYEYQPVAGVPYNERLEIATNLSSIKDPHEVAAVGRPRVSFVYAPSGANRDRVTSQRWGTDAAENATFTYGAGSVESTDGLGQVRRYTITGTGLNAHVTQIEETAVATAKDVPFGVLPANLTAGAPAVENKDRTLTFTFDTDATLMASNLAGVGSQSYTYKNAGSPSAPLPGKVPLEITSGDVKKTFEFADNGAFLEKISTPQSGSVAVHEPNRDSLVATTSNDDVNVTSNYDKAGRLLHAESGGGTDQGRGASSTTISPKPDDSRHLFERGEVSSIARGTDLTTFLYTADSTIIRGPRNSESTSIDYDAWRRPKHVSKSGAEQSLDESFSYDAGGHLVRHERKQGTATVTTRFEYDEVGRQTKVIQAGVPVKGSMQDLVTATKYDLPNHKIVTTLPTGATVTSDLDTLGRVVHDLTDTGGGPSANIEHHYAYDLAGNRVFATDMKVAAAEAFDGNGRNSGTLHSDGTSTKRTFDEWHNLRSVDLRDKNAAVVQSATITPTPTGRIKSVTESVGAGLTRDQSFAWDGGGRTSGAVVSGRGAHYVFDASSHLSAAVAGAASQPIAVSEPFVSRGLQTHDGLLPQSVETIERFAAQPTRTNLQYDTLGNASHVDLGRLIFDQRFDEAGNLKTTTPPERGTTSYDYDAASRVTQQMLPGGVNKYEHDAAGALSKYTDPDTEQTAVDTDLIGRPLKRHYADGTEERFEYDGPRLLTYTDRQGRKQVYGYDGRGLLETIGVVPGGVIDRIEYDDAGRIKVWTNRDSAVAYSDFNADGLPQTTVVTRYKDHTGLAAPPTVAGEYRQEHRYNEHGERIEWSMPRPAGFTTTAPWTDRVYEHHDAMGNVDQLERALFGAPRSTLLTGQYRNAGRPKQRTLVAASGAPIVRDYAYEESTSLGNEMKVSVGGKVVAGSAITQWSGLLIREASLLGVSNATRANHYEYDARGRLISYDAGRTVTETPSPADFRATVTRTPRFDAATRAQVASKGVDVNRIDPPGTIFTPSSGHKIATAAQGPTTTPFAYNGSELTSDGKFSYEWDEKGRLTRATGGAGVRVSYSYDPNDRIIGRTVESSTNGSGWQLATPELITDGLPADATFVFDPLADRVAAIFDATTGAPVRQVIHGGLGYDDPIEVTLTDPTGANKPIQRLYPIYDEAGAGNLQAVLNVSGEVVSRHMAGDAYGDERTSFTAAAIDRVTISSTTSSVTIDVRATELLRADSIAGGIRIAAIDNAGKPIRTAPLPPTLSPDGFTARTTLTTAEWQTLTAGAAGVSVGATNTLRAAAWGAEVPILPAPPWATASKPVYSTTPFPFEVRESLSNLSTTTGTTTLYEVEDLALLGSAGDADDPARFLVSSTFQALPYFDSVTHLTYARARWLNHKTGQFLSPDPVGYADSANLYSYCAGDPVNCTDPLGTERLSKRTLELVKRQATSPELHAAVRTPAVQGSAAAVRDKMTGAVIGLVPGSENVGLVASAARVVNATRQRGIRGGAGAAFDEWKNQLKGLPFVNWYFEGEAASNAAAARDEYAEAYHRVSLGINAASDTAFVIGGAETVRANGVPRPVRTARVRPQVSASTGGEFANDFRAVEQPFDFRTAYRYVGEGEAKVIRATGRVPNVSLAGTPKNVSFTPQLILSGSEAEQVLRMGRFNPVRPYPGPVYGVEVDISGVRLTYAGNSEVGAFGIELQTTDSPLALRIFKLNQ